MIGVIDGFGGFFSSQHHMVVSAKFLHGIVNSILPDLSYSAYSATITRK